MFMISVNDKKFYSIALFRASSSVINLSWDLLISSLPGGLTCYYYESLMSCLFRNNCSTGFILIDGGHFRNLIDSVRDFEIV